MHAAQLRQLHPRSRAEQQGRKQRQACGHGTRHGGDSPCTRSPRVPLRRERRLSGTRCVAPPLRGGVECRTQAPWRPVRCAASRRFPGQHLLVPFPDSAPRPVSRACDAGEYPCAYYRASTHICLPCRRVPATRHRTNRALTPLRPAAQRRLCPSGSPPCSPVRVGRLTVDTGAGGTPGAGRECRECRAHAGLLPPRRCSSCRASPCARPAPAATTASVGGRRHGVAAWVGAERGEPGTCAPRGGFPGSRLRRFPRRPRTTTLRLAGCPARHVPPASRTAAVAAHSTAGHRTQGPNARSGGALALAAPRPCALPAPCIWVPLLCA